MTCFKRHDDSMSDVFTKKLADNMFVFVLRDMLPLVAQMSMLLQKQDVIVAAFSGLKDGIKLTKKGRTLLG